MLYTTDFFVIAGKNPESPFRRNLHGTRNRSYTHERFRFLQLSRPHLPILKLRRYSAIRILIWENPIITRTTNFITLLSGQCRCFISHSIYRLFPGDLIMIPPSVLHRVLYETKRPAERINIFFRKITYTGCLPPAARIFASGFFPAADSPFRLPAVRS